ncbi:RNA polymerase II transcription factor SIII subunit A-domain-containing protein [Cyathus striatus]|nr:RNA polymerase II transcription factor SIII subunit A-domain-containing protein [Cyathus striatus]
MASDSESPTYRRIPSLVQLCQRAAASNVDSISTLGDDLAYNLVKPILERCNAEQLLRLEHTSSYLERDTSEIWKNLCYRKYPTVIERYLFDDSGEEPTSWKERYFLLEVAEAKRLEEAASKLRSQRLEAEERKKEREVKLTDRVPPPKRPRTSGWGTSLPQKTLFQKTKSEASKIQKAMYNARILPPMPGAKGYRVLPKSPAVLPSIPSATNRVTVNTVVKRCPAPNPLSSPAPTSPPASKSVPAALPRLTLPNLSGASSSAHSFDAKPAPLDSHMDVDPRPPKIPKPVKKDPMAMLFVPKHRAHSQRPVAQHP